MAGSRPLLFAFAAAIALALCAIIQAQDTPAPKPQGRPATEEKARNYPPLPKSVERHQVTIWSDGTRMAADLYLPKILKPEDRLPAVVFVNGTGGTKRRLPARLAPHFVGRGYAFLAFDFRGWGESESKLLMLEPMPEPNAQGEVTVKARAIRWQMDFSDQCADIRSAIAFLSGEKNVDPARIGLLGTSYGGGLVTWTAAHDPRVKCVAMQVPGMGGGRSEKAIRADFALLTRQARGETEPVPYQTGKPGGKMSSYAHMRYNYAKRIGHNNIEAAEQITIPVLIIDVENEELMKTEMNGKKVAEILQKNGTPVKYHILKGATHYGIYREGFEAATALEIAWFEEHLKEAKNSR
jgi:dienelactone hydrolase